jgi:hypothetical protein
MGNWGESAHKPRNQSPGAAVLEPLQEHDDKVPAGGGSGIVLGSVHEISPVM